MVGIASRLQRRGVRATYMSMGDVGHWFSRDMDGYARTDIFQRTFTDDRPLVRIPTYEQR